MTLAQTWTPGADRWKLMPLVGVISAFALVIAGGLMAFGSQASYRAQKLSEVEVQARVVGASVAGALAFEDHTAANEYLGALKANPELASAAAYDAEGRLLAQYARTPREAPPQAPPKAGAGSEGDYFVVTTPVVQRSTRLGTVYLRTDAESFLRRAGRYAGVAILAVMASLIIGIMVAAYRAVHAAHETLSRKAEDLHNFAVRQEAVFDAAFDAIVTLDPNGAVEGANKAAERMFGRPAGALTGLDLGSLIELEGDAGAGLLQRLGVSDGQPAGGLQRELIARRADGTSFPVDLALGAMELPDGLHFVAVVRDITDRRRTERLKSEFVSTVSHELRTPLTSIAGSLGLLAGGAAGELPERAGRLLAIAHANCQRLVRLINDILDIEKLESGALRFDFAPAPLEELAARAIEGLRGYADELGVGMKLVGDGAGLTVRADCDRMIQVLTNLISNALKFSPAGGTVDVELSRQPHGARVTVRDRGAGIPEEFRARVFAKFAQADSTDSRRKGGTGLGLAISKEIVERHGGRLSFDSVIGEGSSFHVDLPLVDAVTSRPAATGGERILVCEDDPDTAAILRETLERDGFQVEVTGTLQAAREALASRGRYAALLLDLRLPDGDGVELIHELRDVDATRELPVIVISAFIEQGRDAAEAHALNVIDWMEKPVDIDRLQRAVRAALARSRPMDRRPIILHVDDDPDILQVTATALAELGDLIPAANLTAARAALAKGEPDLVILDIGLGEESGLDLLAELENRFGRAVPVIVFSARETDQNLLLRVDEVLVKSRASLASLAQAVRRLVRGSAAARPIK